MQDITLLLLKAFLICIAALGAFRLVQALIFGVARFGAHGLVIHAVRRDEPGTYWFILAIHAGVVAFLLWAVFG